MDRKKSFVGAVVEVGNKLDYTGRWPGFVRLAESGRCGVEDGDRAIVELDCWTSVGTEERFAIAGVVRHGVAPEHLLGSWDLGIDRYGMSDGRWSWLHREAECKAYVCDPRVLVVPNGIGDHCRCCGGSVGEDWTRRTMRNLSGECDGREPGSLALHCRSFQCRCRLSLGTSHS